jgi:hypothetical protein
MLADAWPPRADAMQRKAWRHAAKCAREAVAVCHAGGRVLERPRLTCLSNRLFDTHYAFQKFFHNPLCLPAVLSQGRVHPEGGPALRLPLCSGDPPLSQKFSHACELLAAAAPPRAPPAGSAAAPACAASDCRSTCTPSSCWTSQLLLFQKVCVKKRLVRDEQTHPHRPRLVVSHSTCPPLSSSPHANSFVIGPAVIKHAHTQKEREVCLLNEQRHWPLQNQTRGSRLGSLYYDDRN